MKFTGLWGASVRDLYKVYFIIIFALLDQVCIRRRVYCKDDACICSAGCARGCVDGVDGVCVCSAGDTCDRVWSVRGACLYSLNGV